MFNIKSWTGVVTSLVTHTLAFLLGAGLIFTMLTAALTKSFLVKTEVGQVLCVPYKGE